MSSRIHSIEENLDKINKQIAQACHQHHRQNNVTLLAVSKTKPASSIITAYQVGQRHFGENYLQEALEKQTQLAHLPDICWHYIGPIQSNKTKQIAENFQWVHSVDRAKIIERLNNQRKSQDTSLNICLQVNISDESSKSGIMPDEVFSLAKVINNCENLCFRGLMAIPAKNAPVECYEKMQHLFKQLQAQYSTVDTLSLGMSNDLEIAISKGSTLVRIGTAIFGDRQAKE